MIKTKDWSGAFTAWGSVVYPTMRHACIGRMYEAALANVPKLNKRSSSGWADLARATGIEQPKLRKDGSRYSMSRGVSNRIYSMAMRGTLPKDPEQLRKLLELAGSPWLEEFSNEHVRNHATNQKA
jgi:hypothetical protein